MSSNIEKLYYACGSFRDALFHFVTTRKQMYTRYDLHDAEKERILDFERERVKSRYLRLKELIEICENELKE